MVRVKKSIHPENSSVFGFQLASISLLLAYVPTIVLLEKQIIMLGSKAPKILHSLPLLSFTILKHVVTPHFGFNYTY